MTTLDTRDPRTGTGQDWRPRRFRVMDRRRESSDTWTLELEGDDPLVFAPGQFTMLSAGGCGEVPISISGDPSKPDRLVQTIRVVGLATEAICAARPGQVLGVRGPFGRPWPVDLAAGGDVHVVAGGCGLAPVRPIVYAALRNRRIFDRVTLLYGARGPDAMQYRDELARWSASEELDVALTVDTPSPEWAGAVGFVGALVEDAPVDPRRTVAFVCGPEAMMRAAARALRDRGLPDERIYVSLERNMQCGFGVCGHCQLGPHVICRDGPVFSLAEIGRWLEVPEL